MRIIKALWNSIRLRLFLRTFFLIVLLVAGAFFLFQELSDFQVEDSMSRQEENCSKILTEVNSILRQNATTIDRIETEFNTQNQTTAMMLSDYLNQKNLLSSIFSIPAWNQAAKDTAVQSACKLLQQLCTDTNAGYLYIINTNGTILLSSETDTLGKNVCARIEEEALAKAAVYQTENSGRVVQDGTLSFPTPSTVRYNPIKLNEYSCYLTHLFSREGKTYFLLFACSNTVMTAETTDVRSVKKALSGITVGRSGFLLTVEHISGKLSVPNAELKALDGKNYTECGLEAQALADGYVGFQTIQGVPYYCVTQEFHSAVLGDFSIVAVSEKMQSTFLRVCSVVLMACLIFLLVTITVVSYGLILRRDISEYTVSLYEKFVFHLQDDVQDGRLRFTPEEIQERAQIKVLDAVDRISDERYLRLPLGFRDHRGVQHFVSLYPLRKLLPVVILGLVLVFGLTFFSQSLLSLQDVIALSHSRQRDIASMLTTQDSSNSRMFIYLKNQYLVKTKLISNILEDDPSAVFPTAHSTGSVNRLFSHDQNGNKVFLKDMYDNVRLAEKNNPVLQKYTAMNNLLSIRIFNENGNVLSTSDDSWYYTLPEDTGTAEGAFRNILDGRIDSLASDKITASDGSQVQYVASLLYYYTYQLRDGSTAYASQADYKSYQAGTWKNGTITRHKGMVQVCVDLSTLANTLRTTSISYTLNGLHIYGSNSFFMAFSNNNQHTVLYSPTTAMIGCSAAEVGLTDAVFPIGETYHGFQTLGNVRYYVTCALYSDTYIASMVPMDNIYASRNAVTLQTVVYAAAFMLLACLLLSLSSDWFERSSAIRVKRQLDRQRRRNASGLLKHSSKSSAVRYHRTAWNQRTPEKKLSTIVTWLISILSLYILCMLLYSTLYGSSNSIIVYLFQSKWEHGLNIFAVTASLLIFVLLFTGTKLFRFCVRSFCAALGSRSETVGDLLVSVVEYGGAIGGIYYCLHLFGVTSDSLKASAGILTLAISMGTQSLIGDIVAGIFIVFEGEFQVGDIVTINDFRGRVLEIGLRTTRIEEIYDKNIKIFNNSTISGVLNMTHEDSYAVIYVGVEYGADLEHIEEVLRQGFPKIRKHLPAILDGPYYDGVEELADSSVNIRIRARCNEEDLLDLQRALNREIFLLFRQNDINIPFPQVTLSYLQEDQP